MNHDKVEKEMFLLKEKMNKRQIEPSNNQTVDNIVSKIFVLQKICSQFDICGKSLDFLVRNSTNSHKEN